MPNDILGILFGINRSDVLNSLLCFSKMDMQFFYEDEQGHVVDEHGVEPVDLAVDEELFAIETISSHTQFFRINLQKDHLSLHCIQLEMKGIM